MRAHPQAGQRIYKMAGRLHARYRRLGDSRGSPAVVLAAGEGNVDSAAAGHHFARVWQRGGHRMRLRAMIVREAGDLVPRALAAYGLAGDDAPPAREALYGSAFPLPWAA